MCLSSNDLMREKICICPAPRPPPHHLCKKVFVNDINYKLLEVGETHSLKKSQHIFGLWGKVYIIMVSQLYVILILYKVTLIMVIDVFSLKSYTLFPFEIALWFRTKLNDTQFNHHFITTILKSQNSSSQYQYLFDLVASLLKSGNKGLIHLTLYPKQKWCNRGRKWCAI